MSEPRIVDGVGTEEARRRVNGGPEQHKAAGACENSLMSYIYVHVPMSPRASTSIPDEWWIVKGIEKWLDLW